MPGKRTSEQTSDSPSPSAPRYAVEFMLDNTLGRAWYDMTKGETRLKDSCRYLIRCPHEVFLVPKSVPYALEEDDWVRAVALTADFGKLPENPGLREAARFALMIDGYAEMERLEQDATPPCGPSDAESGFAFIQAFVDRVLNPQLESLEDGGHVWTGSAIELWCCLFMIQRKFWREGWRYSHNGDESASDLFSCEPQLVGLWQKIRDLLRNSSEGCIQDDLLRQPVFIPHRPMTDPREIRMPDLACRSTRIGPYAFGLFKAIYEEHISLNPPPYEPPPDVPDPFPHETVRKRAGLRSVQCQYANSATDAATARVVILTRSDDGDGLKHEGPYVVADKTRFRPAVAREIPLAQFDYRRALREGWMTPEQGRRLVLESDAITYESPPPPPTREERIRQHLQDIPADIHQNNLPGVDTDPRAGDSTAPETASFDLPEAFPGPILPKPLRLLMTAVFEKVKQAGAARRSINIEDLIKTAISGAEVR